MQIFATKSASYDNEYLAIWLGKYFQILAYNPNVITNRQISQLKVTVTFFFDPDTFVFRYRTNIEH
jgi:hypothetical protein